MQKIGERFELKTFFLEIATILGQLSWGVLFVWPANIFNEPKWSSDQKRLDVPGLAYKYALVIRCSRSER